MNISPRSLAVCVLLLAVGAYVGGCANEDKGPRQRVADEYLRAMDRGDPRAAAELFHYPEDEKGADLKQDQKFVAAAITVLHTCMGTPSHPSPGYNGVVLELGAGGGDLAHWRQHGQPRTTFYSVQLGKTDGRVSFDFIQGSDGTWGIRQVKYGLPLADPRTRPLIAACSGKLSSIM